MTTLTQDTLRTGVLTELVKRAPTAPGRTALMKFSYLLQAVRRVPLGYRFRLYNYGPYDEQVLADAKNAVDAGLLKSTLVTYQNGYGYEYELASKPENSDNDLEKPFSDDIDWVIENFGEESAARLELISTLVFALCDKSRRLDTDELVSRVKEIKPHFTVAQIHDAAEEISGVLDCVTCK